MRVGLLVGAPRPGSGFGGLRLVVDSVSKEVSASITVQHYTDRSVERSLMELRPSQSVHARAV
jgi:hypothetical protein